MRKTIQYQAPIKQSILVGGWTNPFEKYARQNGSFPQIGVKIKNIWNHHLVFLHPRRLKVSSGIVPSDVRSAVNPSPLQGIEGTPVGFFKTKKWSSIDIPVFQRLRSFQTVQLGWGYELDTFCENLLLSCWKPIDFWKIKHVQHYYNVYIYIYRNFHKNK